MTEKGAHNSGVVEKKRKIVFKKFLQRLFFKIYSTHFNLIPDYYQTCKQHVTSMKHNTQLIDAIKVNGSVSTRHESAQIGHISSGVVSRPSPKFTWSFYFLNSTLQNLSSLDWARQEIRTEAV